MKICNRCGETFAGRTWKCPDCLHEPPLIDSLRSFIKDAEPSRTGYDASYYEKLAALEQMNFWFRSRNRLILYALQRYFPGARSFFEIGCGTGYVLSAVERRFPGIRASGSDQYPAGLRFAARRVRTAELFLMDARRMPFMEEFDVIGAFDVLEHVVEDGAVLGQMHRALGKGGGIILTVPHHPFLWSRTDDNACHVRRYDREGLREKVEQAGFSVVRMTAFVSLLFPLMAASRWRKRNAADEEAVIDELRLGSWTNIILERMLDLERLLIRAGVSFPFGGS